MTFNEGERDRQIDPKKEQAAIFEDRLGESSPSKKTLEKKLKELGDEGQMRSKSSGSGSGSSSRSSSSSSSSSSDEETDVEEAARLGAHLLDSSSGSESSGGDSGSNDNESGRRS